jgi:hypothetical protein
MKKNALRFHKFNGKMLLLERIFGPFVNNDWCLESRMIPILMNQLSREGQIIFNFNPKEIDWNFCAQLNPYGMQKYFYKMDSNLPNKAPGNIISHRSQVGFFADRRYFLGKANKVRAFNLNSIFERVIFSGRVQNEMKTSLEGAILKWPMKYIGI